MIDVALGSEFTCRWRPEGARDPSPVLHPGALKGCEITAQGGHALGIKADTTDAP